MPRTLSTIVLLGALTFPSAHTASVPKKPLLLVAAGIGVASADRSSASSSGFYSEAEFVLRPTTWFTPRAYAGLLIVPPGSDCGATATTCDVSAKIVFLGAKARLMAPIPYVAPFLELGLGLSVGSVSTRVGTIVDAGGSGLMYHVPFAFGLALGERHQWEVSFQYLEHPDQRQTNGAVAVGFAIPLG